MRLSPDITQMSHDTTAAILGMVGAVEHRHVFEVERAQSFQAGNVDAILMGIGAPLVERVDATLRTEEMFRRACVETVFAQRVFALVDPDAIEIGGDGHRTSHAAERTVASPRGAQPIGELHREADGTAVTGSAYLGDVGEHR